MVGRSFNLENTLMKKFKYILYLGLFASVLSACKKDLLNKIPQDSVSSETFWKTSNDAFLAVNGCYQNLPGDAYQSYYDAYADNAYAQYPWESIATVVSSGDVNLTVDFGWEASYKAIRRFNYLLENIDKTPEDKNLLERYKAEVRFLRAYQYLNMILLVGDVPLVTRSLAFGEELPRTKEEEVLSFVLKELADAAAVLPVSYAGGKKTEKGRVTKGAALALKARAHLYYKQWAEAVAAAKQVKTLGYSLFKVTAETNAQDLKDDYSKWVNFADAAAEKKFRLGLRSYEKLFYTENEGNSEVILEREYTPEKDTHGLNTLLLPAQVGGWASISPTQPLVDDYWMSNGQPHVPVAVATRAAWYNAKDPKYMDEYKNRDPRFYASIEFDGNPWNLLVNGYSYDWGVNESASKTGYGFRKLVDPNEQREYKAFNNTILIRYAEVLLTQAEAQNELSGPGTEVYDALDEIRTRVGMPVIDRVVYNNQDKVRLLIQQERRIELAGEGHRYFDIRRWGIAPAVMKDLVDLKNSSVQKRIWSNKLMKLPVPQAAVDKNTKLNPNNTGY